MRGLLKLTTTLRPIESEIEHTWKRSLAVLAVSLITIILTTSWMIRRTVVRPIIQITDAMKAASGGDLNQKVPVFGRDELSTMATSFNQMISELLDTYTGLHQEQNKLTTIILSAQEGIVVTDGEWRIVLVNPAAEQLLGKKQHEIEAAGFDLLFDDADLMASWLERAEETPEPNLHEYNGHILSISVSTITDQDRKLIGSSALLRDVTKEKKLEEELRALSNTDGLTKLFNRRFLDKSLTLELERACRYGTPLSMLMFDVDHFKKFNDIHGHDQGDRVLQAIAEIMRATCRSVDVPCRYGGEEFVVILPNALLEDTVMIGQRLREAVENIVVDGLHVTISIGVASVSDHKPENAAHFINLCDAALYQAKAAGRNCLKVADILEMAET